MPPEHDRELHPNQHFQFWLKPICLPHLSQTHHSDAGTGESERPVAPQYLADQLTLFQPESAHPLLLGTPKIFHLPASLHQIHLFYVLIGLCITPLPTTEKSGKPQRELRCSCLQFDKVSYCLEFGIMDFNENGLQWPALVTEKSIKIQHQMTNSVKLPPTNAPKMGLQNDFPFPTHKQRKTFAS